MKSIDDLVSVRFKVNTPPFLAGEVAGFIPKQAMRYVDGGAAVLVKPPPGLDETGQALEEPEPPKAKPKAAPKRRTKPKAK